MKWILVFLILCTSPLECALFFGPHRFDGFIETGRFKRKREGGVEQSGTLFGYGAEYERLKEIGFYIFARANEDKGTLKGSTEKSVDLKSRFCSEEYLGRLGFSFGLCQWTFVPFIGGGYYTSTNRFVDPSPLHVSMQIHFPYALAGLKVEWKRSETIHYFTSLTIKRPYEPKCRIQDDPEFFTTHQMIKEKLQAEFELGGRYNWSCTLLSLAVDGSFFYRYNRFGSRENYPFNFLDTKYTYLGFKLGASATF